MNPRPCRRCGRMLSKARLAERKHYCYPCQCKIRREQKVKAHDRSIESEDFTREDYWLLYKEQEGHCAVYTCRAQGKSKHLAVEHDHKCDQGHEPNRWCRKCVRGLVCAMHNEWIGRSGDNPEIFDSLASYLRDPPARRTLMFEANGALLNGQDAVIALIRKYGVPEKKAVKILNLARGVGSSPQRVTGGTITVRYIREPRNQTGLYEIRESIEQSEPGFRISGQLALARLQEDFGFSGDKARRSLNIAWEYGDKAEPCVGGYVHIFYHGRGAEPARHHLFSVADHTKNNSQERKA